MPVGGVEPLPHPRRSASLRRVSTSTLSAAMPAIPEPMKPAPTTASRRIGRGGLPAAPGGTPSSFLSAVVAKKISNQLAGHVTDGEFAEGAVPPPPSRPLRQAERVQADLHRFQCGERRRVVATGLRCSACFRGLPIYQPPSGRGAVEEQNPGGPRFGARRWEPPPAPAGGRGIRTVRSRMRGAPARPSGRACSALAARSFWPVRIMSSAARAPIRRGSRWQPPAPGNQAELHLGKAEQGLGMIGGDAIVAGERQLEAAAEAGAVNRGDDRLGQGLDPAHHFLAP